MAIEYRIQTENNYAKKTKELLSHLPPYVTDFYNSEKGASEESTLFTYVCGIQAFLKYESASNPLYYETPVSEMPFEVFEKLTPSDIDEYRNYLYPLINSAATTRRKLSTLAAFYKYLNRTKATLNNPMVDVKWPALNKKRIIRLDATYSAQLLDGILRNDSFLTVHDVGDGPEYSVVPISEKNRIKREPYVTRNYAIIMLILGTGIRISELVGLDIDDVNLKTGTLNIIGKGGDQRDVFFGPEVADALRAYMVGQPIPDDFYEKFGVKGYDYVEFCRDKLTLPNLDEALKNAFPELTDDDIDDILKVAALLRRNGRNSLRPLFGERALFISNRRTRMSVRMVQKMVKEMVFTYLPDYYDKENFSVHKLRTTCCTRILSQTGDLVLAQNQLGHSSIATTSAFYAAWSKEEKQKVVKGLDVTKNW